MVDALAAPAVGSIGAIDAPSPCIALTFDDGPDPGTTLSLLDSLARHDATATFFFLTPRAEAHPELVRAVVAAGHEVGLHGLHHTRLTDGTPQEVRAWLIEGRQRLEAVSGTPIRWFRPPFGSQSARTYAAVRRTGMRVVVWNVDAEDWVDGTPAETAERALQRAQPGSIVLLHEVLESDARRGGTAPTLDHVAVADRVLDGFDQRGWSVGSVGSLLATGRAVRTAWFRP